jgi:hypothetical protein
MRLRLIYRDKSIRKNIVLWVKGAGVMSILPYLIKMAVKGIEQSDFMKRQKEKARQAEIKKEHTKPVLSQDEINKTLNG